MKNNNNSNNIVKVILGLLVVVYCISPVDLAPGPMDDLMVILLGFLANQIGTRKHIGPVNRNDIIDVEG